MSRADRLITIADSVAPRIPVIYDDFDDAPRMIATISANDRAGSIRLALEAVELTADHIAYAQVRGRRIVLCCNLSA